MGFACHCSIPDLSPTVDSPARRYSSQAVLDGSPVDYWVEALERRRLETVAMIEWTVAWRRDQMSEWTAAGRMASRVVAGMRW